MGLAFKTWNSARGNFGTWIGSYPGRKGPVEAAMYAYIEREARMTSKTQKRLLYGFNRVVTSLKVVDGVALTPEQVTHVATQLGVSEKAVTDHEQAFFAVSTSSPVAGGDLYEGTDEVRELGDTLTDEHTVDRTELLRRQQLAKELGELVLDKRERYVLRGYLRGTKREVLAAKLDRTPGRITQIYTKAAAKLEHAAQTYRPKGDVLALAMFYANTRPRHRLMRPKKGGAWFDPDAGWLDNVRACFPRASPSLYRITPEAQTNGDRLRAEAHNIAGV
jgi:hypothetical protein